LLSARRFIPLLECVPHRHRSLVAGCFDEALRTCVGTCRDRYGLMVDRPSGAPVGGGPGSGCDLLHVARPRHRKRLLSPHAFEQGAIGPARRDRPPDDLPAGPFPPEWSGGPSACSASGLPSRRPSRACPSNAANEVTLPGMVVTPWLEVGAWRAIAVFRLLIRCHHPG